MERRNFLKLIPAVAVAPVALAMGVEPSQAKTPAITAIDWGRGDSKTCFQIQGSNDGLTWVEIDPEQGFDAFH